MMTPTRVETRLHMEETKETSTSKPWGTSWCSKVLGLTTEDKFTATVAFS